MKRNIYIALTVVCVFIIILIQSFSSALPSETENRRFSIRKETLLANPTFAFLSLVWAVIFFTGIAKLIIFGIRKFQKQPLINIREEEKPFTLPEKESSKLLFLVSLLLLITYLLPLTGFIVTRGNLPLNILLYANLFFQLGTAGLVLKYIHPDSLGVSFKTKYFAFLPDIYCALLPVYLVSILATSFTLEKLGLKYSYGPAQELFFSLESRASLLILSFQAVVLAPLAEELFFRGFIYKLVRSRYAFSAAAVLTSVFFAVIHRSPYQILPLFFISMLLCYTYEKTQNIIAPIILHSLNNLVALSFLLILKSAV